MATASVRTDLARPSSVGVREELWERSEPRVGWVRPTGSVEKLFKNSSGLDMICILMFVCFVISEHVTM